MTNGRVAGPVAAGAAGDTGPSAPGPRPAKEATTTTTTINVQQPIRIVTSQVVPEFTRTASHARAGASNDMTESAAAPLTGPTVPRARRGRRSRRRRRRRRPPVRPQTLEHVPAALGMVQQRPTR